MKLRWIPLLFILPIIIYLLFRLFETELTSFIIPFFPYESDKSFGFYRDFLRLCFNEMLWLCFFLLTAWLLLLYVPLERIMNRIERHIERRRALYFAATVCTVLVTAVMIGYYTLEAFPNSADEYVYLHQAETLSQGKLMQTAHPLEDFFHFNHIAQKDGIRVGRFPPGWPLLLSIPFFLNVPPLWLSPILAIVTLLCFHRFVKRYYGSRVALWSLLSLSFTGFFIFNSASFFSHTSCLLFTLGFVYCLYLNREKDSNGYALLAGMCLGMIVITRYYTAVLIFLPILLFLVCRYQWKSIRPLFFIGLGTLPFIALLFWYNYKITGNGLLPVTVWIDPNETLGFVKGHTFTKAVEHLIRRILLFLYWSSPAVLILYFVFLYRKLRGKTERLIRPEDYYLVLLLVGYFFYHHLGGNQYGPRFVFEAYPFAIAFVVDKVFQMRAKWALALFAAGMIYAVVKMPYIIARENRVVRERLDLYNHVEQAGISDAVIFISSHTGVIRPMPVSDLTRNGMDYRSDIIYAHDRGEKNIQLIEYYPSRAFYKYIRDPENVKGQLVKLR